MKKTITIDGKAIEVKIFKTRSAANNFIKKSDNRKMVFFRAHEYYVNI